MIFPFLRIKLIYACISRISQSETHEACKDIYFCIRFSYRYYTISHKTYDRSAPDYLD